VSGGKSDDSDTYTDLKVVIITSEAFFIFVFKKTSEAFKSKILKI
jgi:hypothetical protein